MSDPFKPDPAAPQSIPAPPAPPPPSASWQRLDRRMLLVHPITELIRFIPVLLATLIAGARSDSPMWSLGVVGIIVVLAITRWFTTTYRITPDNVELRTGLIQRKRLSVPRTRVRSVDVEADLLHRALLRLGAAGLQSRLVALLDPHLKAYGWPGNVRELENVIERVAVFFADRDAAGRVGEEELRAVVPELFAGREVPDEAPLADGAATFRASRDAHDKAVIKRVLEECGGNQTEAARRLGVGRSTLWRKLCAPAARGEGE